MMVLIISENEEVCSSIVTEVKKEFDMTFFISREPVGLQMEFNAEDRAGFIHQASYIEKLLIRFNMNRLQQFLFLLVHTQICAVEKNTRLP